MRLIPVSLAVEGDLDEQVLRQLLLQSHLPLVPSVCYGKRGKDQLRQNANRFNQAARHTPFVIMIDLDEEDCPPGLIQRWLPNGQNQNLLLRIAVRKVEAWLLADREHLAEFLGIAVTKISQHPDDYQDPKRELINLARLSRRREIRQDMVPTSVASTIGKNYAGQLIRFVISAWRVDKVTRRHSPSLDRAIVALERFVPNI